MIQKEMKLMRPPMLEDRIQQNPSRNQRYHRCQGGSCRQGKSGRSVGGDPQSSDGAGAGVPLRAISRNQRSMMADRQPAIIAATTLSPPQAQRSLAVH